VLSEYPPPGEPSLAVSDPYGASIEAYEECWRRIERHLERVVPTALQYLRRGGVFIVSGPPPARLDSLGPVSHGEWRIVDYPDLGLKRGFFIAQRSP